MVFLLSEDPKKASLDPSIYFKEFFMRWQQVNQALMAFIDKTLFAHFWAKNEGFLNLYSTLKKFYLKQCRV